MKEYIEREAVLSELTEELEIRSPMCTEEQNYYINLGLKIALKDIKKLPAADVVEVVRCKDCTYGHFASHCSKYMCEKGCGTLKYSNDFCNYGTRNRN